MSLQTVQLQKVVQFPFKEIILIFLIMNSVIMMQNFMVEQFILKKLQMTNLIIINSRITPLKWVEQFSLITLNYGVSPRNQYQNKNITISNSDFHDNSAELGGAVVVYADDTSVSSSTFTNNRATVMVEEL